MIVIIVTAKKNHLPSEENSNFFTTIPSIDYNGQIWKRRINNYVLFVTNCIYREDLAQAVKHKIISTIVDAVHADIKNDVIEEEFLIAHDGDLLRFGKRELQNPGYIKNTIYHEDKVAAVNGGLANKFKDGHIYIFQHKRGKKMFENFVHLLNSPSLCEENINYALSLFRT